MSLTPEESAELEALKESVAILRGKVDLIAGFLNLDDEQPYKRLEAAEPEPETQHRTFLAARLMRRDGISRARGRGARAGR